MSIWDIIADKAAQLGIGGSIGALLGVGPAQAPISSQSAWTHHRATIAGALPLVASQTARVTRNATRLR